MATTKLTAPSGSTVSVDESRVENLLLRGFTEQESKKSSTKKSTSSKSSK